MSHIATLLPVRTIARMRSERGAQESCCLLGCYSTVAGWPIIIILPPLSYEDQQPYSYYYVVRPLKQQPSLNKVLNTNKTTRRRQKWLAVSICIEKKKQVTRRSSSINIIRTTRHSSSYIVARLCSSCYRH